MPAGNLSFTKGALDTWRLAVEVERVGMSVSDNLYDFEGGRSLWLKAHDWGHTGSHRLHLP
jgi:hypothetical protein